MDGGGLKGTGTASIRVKDINDMPPSFTKEEWITEVDETDGNSSKDMAMKRKKKLEIQTPEKEEPKQIKTSKQRQSLRDSQLRNRKPCLS